LVAYGVKAPAVSVRAHVVEDVMLSGLAMVVDPRSASVSLACLEEHPQVNEKYYAMFSFSRGYFKAFMSSTVAYYAGLIKSDLSVDSDYVNRCTPGEVVEA